MADAAVSGTVALGQDAVASARSFGTKVEESREQAILDRAEKIRQKRELSDIASQGELTGAPAAISATDDALQDTGPLETSD